MEWFSQLKDVFLDPITPIKVFIDYVPKIWDSYDFKGFLAVLDVVKAIGQTIGTGFYCLYQCLYCIASDVYNFLKWLTLGFF